MRNTKSVTSSTAAGRGARVANAVIRPAHFVIRKLRRGRWVVACEGRWIVGAMLSSLPAAAAYASEIAAASGRPRLLVTVAGGDDGRAG